jgi:hypothetical protein
MNPKAIQTTKSPAPIPRPVFLTIAWLSSVIVSHLGSGMSASAMSSLYAPIFACCHVFCANRRERHWCSALALGKIRSDQWIKWNTNQLCCRPCESRRLKIGIYVESGKSTEVSGWWPGNGKGWSHVIYFATSIAWLGETVVAMLTSKGRLIERLIEGLE